MKRIKELLLAIFLLLLSIYIRVYDIGHNVSNFVLIVSSLLFIGSIVLVAHALFMDFISEDKK